MAKTRPLATITSSYQAVLPRTSPVCFCAQTRPGCCPGTTISTANNFSDGVYPMMNTLRILYIKKIKLNM